MADSAINGSRSRPEAWRHRFGLLVLAALAVAASGLFLAGAVLTS